MSLLFHLILYFLIFGAIEFYIEKNYVKKEYDQVIGPIQNYCSSSTYEDRNFGKTYNSEIDFEYPRNNNKPFRKPLF